MPPINMNEDYFRKFNDLIIRLTSQFFVWEYLHIQNKKNIPAYNLRGHFWTPVLLSLFDDFLLLLANIFDKKNPKVLSVYKLLDKLQDENKKKSLMSEINKHESIIKNLKPWRGNCLAHKNIYFLSNPDQIGKKFPIHHPEVKKLINLLIKIIHETSVNFGVLDDRNYYEFYEKVKNQCTKDCQFVLDNGLKKNK